jgi:hypothetical protein
MNKKLALCLSGEFRFFDHPLIIDGFKKFLLIHKPDIFISTWDHIGVSMNHGYIDPSSKKNIDANIFEKIKEIYESIKYLKIENYNSWFESLDKILKDNIYSNKFNPLTINSYTQIYKIHDSINLKSKYEKENNFKYDVVIRARTDNLFINHFNLSIDSNSIYNINFGSAFYPNRIYDILFYGDSNSMDKVSDAFINFQNLINHDFNNGLCKRDACRILYLQAFLSNLKVFSTSSRLCDIYRGGSFEEYYNNIKSWGEFNP